MIKIMVDGSNGTKFSNNSQLMKLTAVKWLMKEKSVFLCSGIEVASTIQHAVTT